MELIPIFLLLGACSGLLAGLLGVGGGVITVPALYYILSWKGYPAHEVMQIAISTSLAAIIVTTALGTWAHHQKKAILYNVLGYLIPGLVIGCISGAQLAYLLPSNILRMIFGIVAVCIGLYFSIPQFPIPKIAEKPNLFLTFFGLLIGHISSLLGVGGGIFTIPILFAFHIPAPNVMATSSATTLTSSIIGTLTYLIMATETTTSTSAFGYIDIPSFVCISLGSVFTIKLGVKLAHYLPAATLKRIFGVVLCVTGISMILR